MQVSEKDTIMRRSALALIREQIYFMRKYEANKIMLNELKGYPNAKFGTQGGMGVRSKYNAGDPTGNAALKIANIEKDIEIVDKALLQVKEEVRDAVFEHCCLGKPWKSVHTEIDYSEPQLIRLMKPALIYIAKVRRPDDYEYYEPYFKDVLRQIR